MKNIQRVSKFFRWIFQIIFVGLPIAAIVFWINAPAPITLGSSQSGFSANFIRPGIEILHPLSLQTKLLGFTVSLIPLAIHLFILYFLIRLFRLFEKGDIFSLNNVKYIKRIGYAVVLSQIVSPFYDAALSAILTWNNPPGHRISEATFSGTNVGLLLTGLLVILISWIMAEGQRLKEEQDYTV